MTEETNRQAAARRRWEGLTPEQRKARTTAGVRAARINAAKRRIARAEKRIEDDRTLIDQLEAEE